MPAQAPSSGPGNARGGPRVEMLEIFVEQLAAALPLIAAAVVPIGVAAVRKFARDRIPSYLWPVLLPLAGATVASLARLGGFDLGDFNPSTADFDAWETAIAGALTGSASVGLHQLVAQAKRMRAGDDPPPADPTDDELDDDDPYADVPKAA